MTMNIGICEDYSRSAKSVQEILEAWAKNRSVKISVRRYASGEALLDSGDALDLLFLDIRLPGISGDAVAQTLRQKNAALEIVFCTAYSEYMRSALDIHAFGYLEKPVAKAALEEIMDDFLRLRFEKTAVSVCFKTEAGFEKYRIEDILYLERVGRKLYLNTQEDKQGLRTTLAAAYEQLAALDFAYIHKGCIVNLKHVKRLVADEITLDNGEVLKLARPRVKEFRLSWFEYMKKSARG
ncbi:MAG: LytTR family DNA-binding domain-containing protein [Eubacterium sp.]|nr:LytTR family DNA-binding domain-containing protein [Eubacterium sp.]